MDMDVSNALDVSAGGTFLAATSLASMQKFLRGARLTAGSANATMKVQETDGSGRVLYMLTAPQNGPSDEARFLVQFKGQVYVTVTGSGAVAILYVP